MRPTLKSLPEPNSPEYLSIVADYEEAILSGLDKDAAAAFALLNERDHLKLLTQQLDQNPNWLNDLILIGRDNLKAHARVNVARLIRQGNAAISLTVAERTSADLTPKPAILAMPVAYSMSEEEKSRLLSNFPSMEAEIIETTNENTNQK